jgi:hypothetical protein
MQFNTEASTIGYFIPFGSLVAITLASLLQRRRETSPKSCTHGKTREEATRNGEEVMEMYVEAWQNEGESLPEPLTLQLV